MQKKQYKRVVCAVNLPIPTPKAYGVQVMKMCEAFAKEGLDVVLIASRSTRIMSQDPFEYYGDVTRSFRIKRISLSLFRRFGRYGLYIDHFLFVCTIMVWTLFYRQTLFFTRNVVLTWALSLWRDVVLEVHGLPSTFLGMTRTALQRAKLVVSTNLWKAEQIGNVFNVSLEKVLVLPNGVDMETFSVDVSKEEARKKLGLPSDKKLVVYTGHLYKWKGVETVIEALNFLEDEVVFVVVGGSEKSVNDYMERYGSTRVCFVGHKSHKKIPMYLKAADVLVLPLIPATHSAKYEASPLKLFEYMASGRPIVISDAPILRELVDDSMVVFALPGDARSFANGVRGILHNIDEMVGMTDCARQRVEEYTWQRRSKKILSYVSYEKHTS